MTVDTLSGKPKNFSQIPLITIERPEIVPMISLFQVVSRFVSHIGERVGPHAPFYHDDSTDLVYSQVQIGHNPIHLRKKTTSFFVQLVPPPFGAVAHKQNKAELFRLLCPCLAENCRANLDFSPGQCIIMVVCRALSGRLIDHVAPPFSQAAEGVCDDLFHEYRRPAAPAAHLQDHR